MPRLIEAKRAAARKFYRSHQPPPFIDDSARKYDALLLWLCHRRLEIIAHQKQLVLILVVRWMNAELRGWEREDEPALSGVHRSETQHIAEECADLVRILCIDECVNSSNHRLLLPA